MIKNNNINRRHVNKTVVVALSILRIFFNEILLNAIFMLEIDHLDARFIFWNKTTFRSRFSKYVNDKNTSRIWACV